MCAVVWLVIDITTAHPYSNEWYRYWNALIHYAAFVGLAIMLARLKALVEKERELTAKEVRELRGFLPICASCKTIRNDQGYWEQIESYIAAHSEVEFTHSICPECTQRLYPEFVKLPAHLDPSTALDAERRGMP